MGNPCWHRELAASPTNEVEQDLKVKPGDLIQSAINIDFSDKRLEIKEIEMVVMEEGMELEWDENRPRIAMEQHWNRGTRTKEEFAKLEKKHLIGIYLSKDVRTAQKGNKCQLELFMNVIIKEVRTHSNTSFLSPISQSVSYIYSHIEFPLQATHCGRKKRAVKLNKICQILANVISKLFTIDSHLIDTRRRGIRLIRLIHN